MMNLQQTNVFYVDESINGFIFSSHWAFNFHADPKINICDFDRICRLDTETLL